MPSEQNLKPKTKQNPTLDYLVFIKIVIMKELIIL